MAMCRKCHSRIGAADVRKQVSEYVHEGESKFYGLPPLPPVSKAQGKLKAMYHYKCYFVLAKLQRQGGRHFEDSPNIYAASDAYMNRDDLTEVAMTRRQIAEARLAELNAQVAMANVQDDADVSALIEEAQAEVALAIRQEEIDAENAKEPIPEGFNDWRDPASIDV